MDVLRRTRWLSTALLLVAVGLLAGAGGALTATINCPGSGQCEGTDNADSIFGTNGHDNIIAKEGDDFVDAFAGPDDASGQKNGDLVWGHSYDDDIFGNDGRDLNCISGCDDVPSDFAGLEGFDGNDDIEGGTGADFIIGGPDVDVLEGQEDDDTIYSVGDNRSDHLHPGGGTDVCYIDFQNPADDASECEYKF
jgi:hypothetical protein